MNEIARYPGATWRPLPEADKQPTIRATQIILHIAVSNADSLYPYWNSTGVGLESHLYVTKIGTCLTPDQRVLTADLRWVPIGDIAVGHRLVGFDETGKAISGGRRYCEATVEWIAPDEADVYAVVMDDEQVVYTTADHRWLTQSKERWTWRVTRDAAGRTLVGARIPRLFATWDQPTSYDVGWMAGILDGEGHMTARHRVSFAQRPTAVLDRAIDHLKGQGFSITDALITGGRGDCHRVDINGGIPEAMRLLGTHRPDCWRR